MHTIADNTEDIGNHKQKSNNLSSISITTSN